MRIANNVTAHNPEIRPDEVRVDRLKAHGWSEEVIQQLQSKNCSKAPDSKEKGSK